MCESQAFFLFRNVSINSIKITKLQKENYFYFNLDSAGPTDRPNEKFTVNPRGLTPRLTR